MCYPYPGPQCEVFLENKLSKLALSLRQVDSLRSRDYFPHMRESENLALWATTEKGQRDINHALGEFKTYAALNENAIKALEKALDAGEKLRKSQLEKYDKVISSVYEEMLDSEYDFDNIHLAVSQASQLASGREHVSGLLEKKGLFLSRRTKNLRKFKEAIIKDYDAICSGLQTLAENKEIVTPDTEDFQAVFNDLSGRYLSFMSKYSLLLTESERIKIDHWGSLVSLGSYRPNDNLDQVFVCGSKNTKVETPKEETPKTKTQTSPKEMTLEEDFAQTAARVKKNLDDFKISSTATPKNTKSKKFPEPAYAKKAKTSFEQKLEYMNYLENEYTASKILDEMYLEGYSETLDRSEEELRAKKRKSRSKKEVATIRSLSGYSSTHYDCDDDFYDDLDIDDDPSVPF